MMSSIRICGSTFIPIFSPTEETNFEKRSSTKLKSGSRSLQSLSKHVNTNLQNRVKQNFGEKVLLNALVRLPIFYFWIEEWTLGYVNVQLGNFPKIFIIFSFGSS